MKFQLIIRWFDYGSLIFFFFFFFPIYGHVFNKGEDTEEDSSSRMGKTKLSTYPKKKREKLSHGFEVLE
jgi:hypothetical protein